MWFYFLLLFTFFSLGAVYEHASKQVEVCMKTKERIPTQQVEMERKINTFEELRHRSRAGMVLLVICGILMWLRGM